MLLDKDIASVIQELALPLWNICTTFAVGTLPAQLTSPRQFCAIMDAVGMPVWSVHRALARVFDRKHATAPHLRQGLLSKAPPYEMDSERR